MGIHKNLLKRQQVAEFWKLGFSIKETASLTGYANSFCWQVFRDCCDGRGIDYKHDEREFYNEFIKPHKTIPFCLMTTDDNVLNHYKQMINPKKSLIRPNF